MVIYSLWSMSRLRHLYNIHMAKAKRKPEKCRICGNVEVLTKEHIIPRAAGGGEKAKLYSGDELIKVVSERSRVDGEKPYGQVRQDGYTAYTLCKSCNSFLGTTYDKDFSEFYRGAEIIVNNAIYKELNNIPEGVKLEDYLSNKGVTLEATKIKPMNIAKRVLASFCSVDHPNLAERKPEIRKAILDKNYKPNTDDFSIYLKLHTGSLQYFGTIVTASLSNNLTKSFAGIELGPIAFYLTGHGQDLNDDCVDITNWLTDYDYDEATAMTISLNFQKPLGFNIPPEAYE